MGNAKLVSTPLTNHFKLSIVQCPITDSKKEGMSKVPYASVVGCLLYAMVCTIPDLTYGVSVVSKFLANLKRQHWDTVR